MSTPAKIGTELACNQAKHFERDYQDLRAAHPLQLSAKKVDIGYILQFDVGSWKF